MSGADGLRYDTADMNWASRLVLGTVQFGLRYGIANQTGLVTSEQAGRILTLAQRAGVRTLDTAIAYGDSEKLLGAKCEGEWKIISKLPKAENVTGSIESWMLNSVRDSLSRLRVTQLHALLLHHPMQLLGSDGRALYSAMCRLKELGLVEMIGISVYGPAELDELCTRFQFDVVQSPFSIIDRRLERSGWLSRLAQAGIQVHVRSVFLQGLLLMDAARRPSSFDRWASLWQHWDRWLSFQSLTAVQACMQFVLGHTQINGVVVGVDGVQQLEEILDCSHAHRPDSYPEALSVADGDLVNPSLWQLQ